MADLDGMTDADLARLIDQARALIATHEQTRAQEAAQLGVSIHAAIDTLTGLLGPETGPPGQGDIHAMLRYSDTQLQTNAGLALRLILLGMRQLTITTRDIATATTRRGA